MEDPNPSSWPVPSDIVSRMTKKILLLCGGRSDEHEISLLSAKCILDALDRTLFTPIVVGISRQGVWHLEEEKSFYRGELRADKIRLNENAPSASIAPFLSPSGRGQLQAQGKTLAFESVFPILHGPFGEDGTLQGLLDLIGIPYVGSTCGSSWICMDKVLTKMLCKEGNVRVADYVWLSKIEELNEKGRAIRALGNTVFVKPSRLGSSVGVAKVTSEEQLAPAVENALKYDNKVLIERAIVGRELECAVLGLNRSAKASLPGEIIVSQEIGWYSYEAKYILAEAAKTLAPAPLDDTTTKRIQEFCLKVFQLLECNGMARVDLFLEHGTDKLFLNEANTIPGFTPISMYPKMWQASGLAYSDLITELIRLGYQRLGKPF